MSYKSRNNIDGNGLKNPTDKSKDGGFLLIFIFFLYFKDLTGPWNIQSIVLQHMQLSMQLQKITELFKSIDNT